MLATVGMTYFTSALDRADIAQRYVPLLKGLAGNIAASVASLQEYSRMPGRIAAG